MALSGRSSQRRRRSMTTFRAGLIALALISVLAYFGLTRSNPFASPEKVEAVFENANGIVPKSPVRIAGVEVGKVTKVTGIPGGAGAARVTMEVKDHALPLHTDAEAKIRTRIFLEGNFFVDIRPGTPSAPILPKGEPIPMSQTSAPVQLGDVLRVLKSDVRGDLRTFLVEFSLKGLGGGGAEAFNETIDFMEPAYKSTAQVADALLGENPDRDLPRVLDGQQRLAAALTVDEPALQGLVSNLNTTVGALAREDGSLAASLPALRDLLRTGQPALASLNGALPPLRRFSVEALPGVRSTPRTIDASLPFIRQTRLLFRRRELRGFTAQTRRQIPRLVTLNMRLIPALGEARTLSSCANRVLIPFLEAPIPSGEERNTGQEVRRQLNRSFVGLAGESRTFDGNGSWFRINAVSPHQLTDQGAEVQPLPPRDAGTPPAHRPDVPCETQDPPNLAAPSVSGAAPELSASAGQSAAKRRAERYVRSDDFKKLIRRAADSRRKQGRPIDEPARDNKEEQR
ncbi:MAG: MlaD family protein [Actinomycetota bacterium]|nr:MlaD family protein [Actinomycetota bacterium]MDQ3647363.1 MlaD family protein [Actinomycetota bacterium]